MLSRERGKTEREVESNREGDGDDEAALLGE
jgi:hypothetical protein